MKIGLVSDSHGDVDALEHACDLLIDEMGAERVFFLGGAWADLDQVFERKRAALAPPPAPAGNSDLLAEMAAFFGKAEAPESPAARKVKKGAVDEFVGRFVRVPEKACPQYKDPKIERILPELIGDKIACLVHDKADLQRENIEMATFLLHGNSAEAALVQIGSRVFITPGRLTGGKVPTCGLIVWEGATADFVALGLEGRELKRSPIQLATRRKMSAH